MSTVINFRLIFRLLSTNLLILGGAFLLCLLVGVYYSENLSPFIKTAGLSFFFGILFHLLAQPKKPMPKAYKRDAFISVTTSWFLISAMGALPYIFSNAIPVFTNAFFESVSGFTTTGASILTDVEILPKSILFWRSLTHWIGGIGIIVIVIVILPSLQIGGYQLFTLEASLQEKMLPKIKNVGISLLIIYFVLTFLETILLIIGGMDIFDSICHSFGTIATGGFSTKNSSIINYSPYIQYVIAIFMILAASNFVIYFYLYNKEFKKIRNNEEFSFYLKVVGGLVAIITLILYFGMGNKPLEESFRESLFQVSSIISCTGFASADYLQWPTIGWFLIFLALFLGGCTGSTAGSIKMGRHLILVKNISRTFKQLNSPNGMFPIRIGKRTISTQENVSVLSFIIIYVLTFIIGTIILISDGNDVATSSGSVASCMAGAGPGIGTVGPVSNYAHLPYFSKSVLSILMILGRLELFTVLLIFTRKFWK